MSAKGKRGGGRQRPVDRVRVACVEILERWLHGGGHVEDLVEEYERRDQSQPGWSYAERRRLREIVFGCVRLRARYDHALDLRRDARKQPPPRLRALLWSALHEISQTRAPDHAVVDQAVEVSRATGLGWASGFVNAVLRRVLREGIEHGFPDPSSDPVEYARLWWSHPGWMVERWNDLLGPAEMLELCEANDRRPRLVLRAGPGRRKAAREALAALEWESAAIDPAPDALELITRVPPALVFDQVDEPLVLQDAAAQLVAPLLVEALGPSSRVLDLCAAPGGKTTHLAQMLGEQGSVVAADLSGPRLARLAPTLERLGLTGSVQTVVADGREAAWPDASFDGVLLDAPCTGTGVLARRHEARWLRREEDLEHLPRLQIELLHRALDLVRPGGVVVYATCSLEAEENDEVVDSVLSARQDVEEIGVGQHLPDSMRRGGRLQTWPHRHGLDGAFAARLRRLDPGDPGDPDDPASPSPSEDRT